MYFSSSYVSKFRQKLVKQLKVHSSSAGRSPKQLLPLSPQPVNRNLATPSQVRNPRQKKLACSHIGCHSHTGWVHMLTYARLILEGVLALLSMLCCHMLRNALQCHQPSAKLACL